MGRLTLDLNALNTLNYRGCGHVTATLETRIDKGIRTLLKNAYEWE